MDKMPLFLVFLQSLPETALLISLGLILIGVKPIAKKIFIIALLTSIAYYFIRALPITSGINLFLQLPVLIYATARVYKLRIRYSALASLLGLIGIFLVEAPFNLVVSKIINIPLKQIMSNSVWRLLFPIPEFLFLIIVIFVLNRRNISLFHIRKMDDLEQLSPYGIKILHTTLLLLGFIISLLALGFYFNRVFNGVNNEVPTDKLIVAIEIIIYIVTLIVVLFTRKLFLSVQHEKVLETQELHIKHLHELIKVIRLQRHDFVNHLQTVYALYKTDQSDKAADYIENLYHEVKVTSEMIQCNIPEFSALLLVKSGVATARGISFFVEFETCLYLSNIKPSEINTVIGNLIDNAFEAVKLLPYQTKTVKFRVYETPKRHVFQIWNPGLIPKADRDKIFLAGFTTKTTSGNRGFGLASVLSTVQKNGWSIIVSSSERLGTRFTLTILKT